MNDRIGDEMDELGRGVEAAVRVPPYELVVQRMHRRRRRRAGAGGLVLAALVTLGVVVLPQVTQHSTGHAVTPTAKVTVAPPTGDGTLTLSDVSFDASEDGLALGRRCAATCHDVVLLAVNKGQTVNGRSGYPTEVPIPGGDHQYVAAGPNLDVAYSPDLAISHDAIHWTELSPPAPVADIAFADGRMIVLVTPSGQPAQIWTGPQEALSWSALTEQSTVPGSDDSARLAIVGDELFVTSNGSGTQPRVAIQSTLGAAWTEQDLGICAPGSQASLAVDSSTLWWIACRNQRDATGHEPVAITTDGGKTFTSVAEPPSTDLDQSIVAATSSEAFLYGGSALYGTNDSGASWQDVLPDVAGTGAPHVPGGHDGKDIWVLAPGSNTIYSHLGQGQFQGVTLT